MACVVLVLVWCGGWDLNPRRPTPSGPQPDPFGAGSAESPSMYPLMVMERIELKLRGCTRMSPRM